MKAFLISQILLLLIFGAGIGQYLGWQRGASYVVGAGLMLVNSLALNFTWGRIIQKKQIALPAGLIVFKYAILAGAVYLILQITWIEPLWFCIGLGTLLVSALAAAVFKK